MSQMPLPSDQNSTGRSLGSEELAYITEAIESGCLTSTKGSQVKALEQDFARFVGAKHAFACTSGSAAVHVALAAINPEPGDEIITTPITDMGALTPIVYQGAIPVFADVDWKTGNVTAETIRARLSDKTRAIIVTHLFGDPCEMDAIMALANERSIPVIEDAAQAFGGKTAGKHVGTFGAAGCFSFQQGKHMTTGEGGVVVTNDDDIARTMFLAINKAWGYGDQNPDHYFIALNYRMCELQGAVARAQLDKLPGMLDRRFAVAAELNKRLEGIEGMHIPVPRPGDSHGYWRYSVMIDPAVIPGGPVAVAGELRELGIPSGPRYVQKPAFRCQVFAEQKTFGTSRWPFTLARPEAVDYSEELFPGAFKMLEQVLVIPINEKCTTEHAAHIADGLTSAIDKLKGVPA